MEVAKNDERFLWLGNWPALDFVNTEIVRDGQTTDLLAAGADFTAWLLKSGLVDQIDLDPAMRDDALMHARKFRQELRRGLLEVIHGRRLPASVMRATNALLNDRNVGLVLEEKNQHFHLRVDWALPKPEHLCAPIALSFAKLLAEADVKRIRCCQNPSCILYFYDTSKSATRSWCSLDLCGNKLRVAAYRQRRMARKSAPD
jgi:predicted RNA-binding Zn ribbon-like protein